MIIETDSYRNSDDLKKYLEMREAGASADEVCRKLTEDDIPLIMQVRALRHVFSFSLQQAMDVVARCDETENRLEKE